MLARPLLQDFQQKFEQAHGGPAHFPLLAGVSGGPDSLALLHALHALGLDLVAAHLDHALRPESGQEARAVQSFCAERQIPLVMDRIEVAGYAQANQLSIEEAARVVRYRFLFANARETGAEAVLVGHTADDQVETVLMHLLRGSGLDGLSGMPFYSLPNPWSDRIPLVRPLLHLWRRDILAYVQAQMLQPNLDPSNTDTLYFRNRLRSELIPYLETYNPQVKLSLLRLSQVVEAERQVLSRQTQTAWDRIVVEQGEGWLAFNQPGMLAQPLALQRRLLRRAVSMLRPGLRDIDFSAIERSLDFLQAPAAAGEFHLPGGLSLRREGQRAWVITWEAELPAGEWLGQTWPAVPAEEPVPLSVPGAISLAGGWELSVERMDGPDALAAAETQPGPYQAWLDAAALPAPLAVRSRLAGDRIRPLGMGGRSMKLSDLMINEGLPQRARAAWPVITAGEEVAWVPGLRVSHSFRLTQQTTRALALSLKKIQKPE